MAELDPGSEEWAALSGLLDEALELPPDERAAWIDALPPEHDAVRPRLQRLLSAASSPDDAFLRTIPKVNAGGIEPDARDLAPPPEHIGPYRVVRKLAEGGMGAVWLAERADGMLNRPVALKLPRGAWTGAGLADRMAREREILAALNHPNIARLYDAGIARRRPAVSGARVRRGARDRRVRHGQGAADSRPAASSSSRLRAPSRTRTSG